MATILGSPPELIGRSIAEQRFLDVKIGTRVLAPGENSRILTRNALNGVSTMMFARRIPKPVHEALGRYAMKVALRDSPLEGEGINLTDELGYPVHPVLDRIVGVLVCVNRLATQSFRIPIVADSAATVFGKLITRVLERGLAGQAADFTTRCTENDSTDQRSQSRPQRRSGSAVSISRRHSKGGDAYER